MVTYISVVSILAVIIVYLVSNIMVLKNELEFSRSLYTVEKEVSKYWQAVAEDYRQTLSSTSNEKVLSESDLKSLIAMIHPDKHPESRKQRATELFIKLKEIQGSKS